MCVPPYVVFLRDNWNIAQKKQKVNLKVEKINKKKIARLPDSVSVKHSENNSNAQQMMLQGRPG